ncbi:MAG: hypothetical protein ACYTEK_05645 [Planctomycetota bacterium]|jgi:hypothetical protein
MCKRLILLTTLVFALGTTAQAALYWTVTDSTWTWPNEEAVAAAVADPNVPVKYTNADTIAIDIIGGTVTRLSPLAIQGAPDGSTTAVLTLNNASSLTVHGRLATSTEEGNAGRGQIDILGGSTVNIIGDGNDLTVSDDNNNWGMLNIVDSTITIADDLRTDHGEAHVSISGNSIIDCDDVIIADNTNGLAFVDIGGTTTITAGDDFNIDNGEGTVNISGDAVINWGDDMRVGDNATGKGYLNVSGNVVLNGGDDLNTDDGEGHITLTDNVVVNVDDFVIVDNDDGVGSLDISGNATINADDFKVVDDQGGTGSMVISGNATINCDDYYGNDDSGNVSSSTVTLNGGTVKVGDDATFNDDNPGTATITVNGGSWISGDDITVSDNLDGNATVTINGGQMICNDLKLGDSGGEDIGQIRVNVNGGLFQANNLSINITDTQIIYTGGVLKFGSADVNEAEMQQLITDGTIVANGVYSIVTYGDYTALNPQSLTQAKLPEPADGAEGVLLGTTLRWMAGDTAATHDVYFGTTNPPAFIGNQEGTAYYQPIEVGTTYYWQVDEIEADGTTKHTGDVWSFTTTADLSTVSEIATQPNPADGAIAVPLDVTLSWWPGATAVSHNGYIGTSSPPPLLGNTTEFSYDVAGLLEPGTTYYWRLDAVAADGTVHTGDVWSFTTLSPPPPEWTCQDIATTDGSASYEAATGTWTIIAGGADIWNNADEFHYCYQQPTLTRGDCTLIANVVSFPVPDGGDNWQKAGLMIRETPDAGSKNAFIAITGGSGDGATFQWRTDTDGSSDSSRTLAGISPPVSIKLVRKDDTFTGYVLLDGQWQQQGEPATVVMADEVYVGLAVTSHKSGVLATAVIDGVSIATPDSSIAWGPDPADGATDIPRTATLSWGPGSTAVSHNLYLSTDQQAVIDGTVPVVNVTDATYTPPAQLDKAATYYWRVDEVEADGTTHAGPVWSFTVVTLGR